MVKYYMIREDDLRGYILDALRMDKLHELGVDNWQGYDDCHPSEEEADSEMAYFDYVVSKDKATEEWDL